MNRQEMVIDFNIVRHVGAVEAILYKIIEEYEEPEKGFYTPTQPGCKSISTKEITEATGWSKKRIATALDNLLEFGLVEAVNAGLPCRRQVKTLPVKKENIKKGHKKKVDRNYIYFIHTELGVKIGLTSRLDKRVPSLSTKIPCSILGVTYFQVNDRVKAEARLHEEFLNKNTRGEWFALTVGDMYEGERILKAEFEGSRLEPNATTYEEIYKNNPLTE